MGCVHPHLLSSAALGVIAQWPPSMRVRKRSPKPTDGPADLPFERRKGREEYVPRDKWSRLHLWIWRAQMKVAVKLRRLARESIRRGAAVAKAAFELSFRYTRSTYADQELERPLPFLRSPVEKSAPMLASEDTAPFKPVPGEMVEPTADEDVARRVNLHAMEENYPGAPVQKVYLSPALVKERREHIEARTTVTPVRRGDDLDIHTNFWGDPVEPITWAATRDRHGISATDDKKRLIELDRQATEYAKAHASAYYFWTDRPDEHFTYEQICDDVWSKAPWYKKIYGKEGLTDGLVIEGKIKLSKGGRFWDLKEQFLSRFATS